MPPLPPRDDPALLLCREVADLVLGEHLGSGISRHVYAYRPNPDGYVVKVEFAEDDFQNVAEWGLWCAATAALAKHLAPCVSISPNGKALLQRRCEPCPRHLLPKRLPSVLADCHEGNFGLYQGRPVLMDYGRHIALDMAASSKTMRSLRWNSK